MEPKIYIDIVFPVTWGMDAFLLWMAGRILGLRRKRWRFAFGGLFAAVCDCAWLFFLQRSGGVLFSLLLLAGGVFIAYTPKSGKILFAADGDNTAFFVPAWRRRTAFVYLYAGTAIVLGRVLS